MVKVWQTWGGTALQEAVFVIRWGWGRKLSDFKGTSEEEENFNKKILKYNSEWTPRGKRKKHSPTVNITLTMGEEVSFRLKIRKRFLWRGGQTLGQGSWRGGQHLKPVCVKEAMPLIVWLTFGQP